MPPALPRPASSHRFGFATGGLLTAAAIALGALLSGCAGLPEHVDRPVSHALDAPETTALGQQVQQQRQAVSTPHASGFVLISGPDAAYGSRLALVESAQKTLDLQYYAIHADASTERLLRGVIAAAQRGVRVRVLLDDFHSTGRDAQVMRLAYVPNIEMRMFNPLVGARNSQLGRMFSLLGDFVRVQQRMHNKLFIADNAMGIAGGRNLGNAYFGNDEAGNFVDLDVLAAGPVVRELSRTFDAYWNNPRAYPVQSLISHEDLKRMRGAFQSAEGASSPRLTGVRDGEGQGNGETMPAPKASSPSTQQQRARIWGQQPMDLSKARWTWAPAAVLVDEPTKIPEEGVGTVPTPSTTQTAASAPAQAQAFAANNRVRRLTPQATTQTEATQGETVVDGLLALMAQTQKDMLIVSPYFVPGPDMKKAFADAVARGVRVRVLTNSLASNDAPLAHAGYARHRPDLLQAGVQLYEMRSELSGLSNVLNASGSSGGAGGAGSSRAMLHSKLLILDGRLLAIGSMNLDLRSQLQNTEIALLIRSTSLATQATEQIEAALREAAWKLERDADGKLLWHAPEGSGLADATTEPDTSAPLRWLLWLLKPFAPDHLL